MNLENYFDEYRKNIIGTDTTFKTPYGIQKLIYADWIASGRMYKPIEEKLVNDIFPLVGNTHSESSITGTSMTKAYKFTKNTIKRHVNASNEDIIILAGFGMTAVVNKLQRILGLRLSEQLHKYISIPKEDIPLVIVTHMEHHSNQTSWIETIADVEVIKPNEKGLVDLNNLEEILRKNRHRKLIIGAITATSNVTGIITPYYEISELLHKYNGLCFVDFAASAPYIEIDMHPKNAEQRLDAIYFSPHKFLGGPGSSGVLILNSSLYKLKIPDHPGGGTVQWTNPWGEHAFIEDIEDREDGGTPGFLQAFRIAFAILLKEKMGTDFILKREHELLEIAFNELRKISGLHILANEHEERIGVISFYAEKVHYNLMVKLLNDKYGIQVRGGCSCAGTYGHYLLHVDPTRSKKITEKILSGDLSEKPGWVRMSLHPTMTNEELVFITNAIRDIVKNIDFWSKDYNYDNKTNEFYNKNDKDPIDIIRLLSL